MEENSLLDATIESKGVPIPASGFIVTNHLNLLFMLSAGLVIPPSGFGNKYYRDTLSWFPGWIPLFKKDVSQKAIQEAVSEGSHLKPCIVEYRLDGISGTAMAGGRGKFREVGLANTITASDQLLLLPAPLPVSRIESLIFESGDAKQSFVEYAKNYGNVSLEGFLSKVAKRKFSAKGADIAEPAAGHGVPERSPSLERALSAGGILAMLTLFANGGDRSSTAGRLAYDPGDRNIIPDSAGPFEQRLGAWMRGDILNNSDEQGERTDGPQLACLSEHDLFWKIVGHMVEWRGRGSENSAEESIMEFLSEIAANVDTVLADRIASICTTLRSLSGPSGLLVSDMFDQYKSALERSLILFWIREDCSGLLDYRSEQLGEQDWIAAAVLFGARDGWMRLPSEICAGRDLVDAVSHRMASLSQRVSGSELNFGEPPPRIRSFRELLRDDKVARPKRMEAALDLARIQKWDCISSQIVLRAGEYRLVVSGESVIIEVPSEPRIQPQLNKEVFWKLLAQSRFDRKGERENIRKSLSA